jgi:nitrilase
VSAGGTVPGMTVRLAAVQAAPAFLDREATVDKAVSLIEEAGRAGAQVVGFPEGFVPGHPAWVELLPFDDQALGLGKRLFQNALEVPSPEVDRIAAACKEHSIVAVVGICERIAGTTGTLFNTQLFFDESGRLAAKHQKFVPTIGERLVHAPGRTGIENSVAAEAATVSGLICGENSNPLAQYSTALAYPSVHVAAWPPHFSPQIDMPEAIDFVSRSLAYSLKCFVINAVTLISEEMVEAYGDTSERREFLTAPGTSARASIVAPTGEVIAKAEGAKQQVLCADVELDDILGPKMVHDVAGHYSRPELFSHLFAGRAERG